MVPSGQKLRLISPAKINLSLAVLGKQADGFHALHSVVTQTVFGDELEFEWIPEASGPDRVVVPGLILPERDNTIWQALALFRQASGMESGQFTVRMEKRIPVGAGLGGGSSNAVTVLRALRQVFGRHMPGVDWHVIAARIGSDCPLFLADKPVIMEGRGERISILYDDLCSRIQGQPVILFKPGFSINTAEAYARLARARLYQTNQEAAALMDQWRDQGERLPPACNDFERLLEEWMPSLAVVLKRLRNKHGLDARLSGSGSACFLFPSGEVSAIKILQQELADAWGSSFWIEETCVK